MDAIHDNNLRPGFIKVYRLWRGLADVGSDLQESLLSGKFELADAEDAKQLQKRSSTKGGLSRFVLNKTQGVLSSLPIQ